MNAVLAAEAAAPSPAAGPETAQVRRVLSEYARTLLLPLSTVPALLAAWTLAAAGGWPAAVAAATGWAVLSGAWLRRRGWHRLWLHAATWGAPLALLTPLIAAGWLTPDGLVLWAPLAGICAVALALAHSDTAVLRMMAVSGRRDTAIMRRRAATAPSARC